MKKNIWVLFLGIAAVFGSYALFAKENKPNNSKSGLSKPSVIKTDYDAVSGTPVDFEKAAATAVPSVVHIKTTTKYKQIAGRQWQDEGQSPFGGMFGDDFFKKYFGDRNG